MKVTRILNAHCDANNLFKPSEETEQIKERQLQAAISKHSGLLVPRNILAQKRQRQGEFVASSLQGSVLSTWGKPLSNRGLVLAAIAQPWEDFKKLLMKEYCPDDEIQKLESEF
ncbi:hypothetical protein Tco_0901895 [Tanacetum coccineum]